MIEAIDVHVHVHDARARALQGEKARQKFEAKARYFGKEPNYIPLDEQAYEYRRRQMMAVLMNGTDESVTGIKPVPNEFMAQAVVENPDVFMAFGIVDPWHGRGAVQELHRIKDMGLRGVGEFNPARQHFFPNDPHFYPLWEAAEELELILLFHSGYAAAGSGTRGGDGVKLKYCEPIHLDDLAADFPDLKIICAHPSWPWVSQSLAIARHKPNFYIDLSGWAPKYFPAELVHQVGKMIPHKALFGSDFPVIGLERWLDEFGDLGFSEAVQRQILLENSAKIFGVALTENES